MTQAILSRGQSDPQILEGKEVLLIGPLKVLDWSDTARPKRIPCKLVLLVEKCVHKLEIYIPAKVGCGTMSEQLAKWTLVMRKVGFSGSSV